MVSIQRFPADWIIPSATEQCRSRECSDLLIRSLMDDYVFYVHLYRLYSTKICWFKSLTCCKLIHCQCVCFLLCFLSRRALAAHPAVRSLSLYVHGIEAWGSQRDGLMHLQQERKGWRWFCLLACYVMYGVLGGLVSGRRDD
jgi:hypothetical protein